MSTRWSTATKFWILTAGTILITLTLYRLRSLVPLVGLAIILAYVLTPLVDRIHRHSPLGRTTVTALVYLGLLALLVTVPAIFMPSIIAEARAIDRSLIQQIITDAITRIQAYSEDSVISILGYQLDLTPAFEQLIENLQQVSGSVATSSLGFFLNFASGFASTLLGIFLTLVLSFYLVKDSHVIVRYLGELIPIAYREEIVGLTDEINQVWRDFFRGQLLLVLVVGFVTWSGLFILGVPNALLLGVTAGLLELIPNLGPILAAVPAVLIAFFQGSTHFGITPGWFALIVVLMYAVIQQVENTVLVPRIIGGSVHLHPVVVLIGILAGATIAGILGIFLAAPVLASFRVLGRYAYDKLTQPAEAQPVQIESPGEDLSPEASVVQRVEQRGAEEDDGETDADQTSRQRTVHSPAEP